MTKLESASIVNLSKVEEELAKLNRGQKAIGDNLREIKDRQAAQNDMLADIGVALVNGFASIKAGQEDLKSELVGIKREITSVGYGIASLNGRQGESVELLKEIAASLKKG